MGRERVHLLYIFLMICYQLQTIGAYNYQVGILYGENTKALQSNAGGSLYKKLYNDASQFIFESQLISDGDRLSAAHYAPPDSVFVRNSHFATARAVCSNMINGKDLHGIIIPDDMCDICGGGIGAMIGEVYTPTFALDQAGGSSAFKMMPIEDDILEMLVGVINHFHWTDFIFIYDDDPAFAVMSALMEVAKENGWQIIGYGLEDDLEAMFEDLKTKKVKNILFYCGFEENIVPVRNAAFKTGAMRDTYHWIFGNVGAHGLGQEDFLQTKMRQDGAFITRFKPETAGIQISTTNAVPQNKWPFRQNAAYDAMLTLAEAIKHYQERTNGEKPEAIPRCGSDKKSPLIKDLAEINIEGLTGEIAFNPQGDRINYTINIYSGKDRHNILKAGQWTQDITHWEKKNRKTWPKPGNRLYMQPFRQSDKDVIKILCIEEPPFLFVRGQTRGARQTDNQAFGYQGFIPDLLEEIKKVMEHDGMDFTYELELMSEGNYGRRDSVSGQWDGMIQELIEDDADIAAGALTKTSIREEAIDFTDHFLKSDIKILIKHPNFGVQEYPFVPVYPFHVGVWFTNLAALVVVTVLLWVMARWNPYEWRQMYQRGETGQEEGDTFCIRNVFWYLWSTLMLQSYTRSPRSHSGRLLSSFWFYFVLVMIFMYGLTITPFLKVSKNVLFIRGMGDLLKLEQTVHYGVVRHSPTYDYFKHSTDETIQTVWAQMATLDRDPFVARLNDGVRRVRRSNGRYALISEEKLLMWQANDWPCELFVTGGTSTRIKYALAVPSGSPLRDQLTYAIKKLKKEGILAKLEKTNWKGSQRCANQTTWEKDSVYSLNSNDLMGVYYMFAIGVVLSIIIFILDWVFAMVFPSEPKPVGRSFNRSPSPQRKPTIGMDDFGAAARAPSPPRSPPPDQGGAKTDWI
ncbi:glutamate receptor 1-like isoform X1 [Amphiura filiformis]|uniref:glutamate receptor 1-like isoform X1 n=1 Tax=Amphiura filiformis TaxID=82378 RepID=UPI003B214981